MGLEAATFIHQLNPSNPVGAVDPKAQGDDHIRMIKSTLQATFPNITGAMTATQAQLNGVSIAAAPSVKVKATGAAAAGAAVTFIRTDAQMLLDLADTYAWTGQHSWSLALRVPDGLVGTPAICFASETGTGIFRNGAGRLSIAIAGVEVFTFLAGQVASFQPIRAPDGTAGAPAYTFANDTNTGFHRPSADVMAAAVGGTDAFQCLGPGATGQPRTQFGLKASFPDGTALLPSITFENDLNTGFYSSGADSLAAACGGILSGFFTNVGLFVLDQGVLFASDNDTGIVRLTTDQIGFKEGGSNFRIGFREIPQNSQSANYGLVLTDNGKHILHPSGAGAGDTFTIPANASVAYPLGTVLTFVNRDSNAVSIAITSDTMILAGTTTTGTRSLAQNGIATAIKVESTVWIISGTGLT